MTVDVHFEHKVFIGMQSRCLLTIKRAAKALICGLCILVCLATPAFAPTGDRSCDQSQLTQTSVAQSADQGCETADSQSASRLARWNIKPEFLSRSMVVVLHQQGLSSITHPAGNLRREFSQPSLFDLGIALRL